MSDGLVFADRVRAASSVARRYGLTVPGFRSPPRDRSADRSLRRLHDGSFVVAITIKGRTLAAIERDIVDGIVAANDLDHDAPEFRAACAEAFDVF